MVVIRLLKEKHKNSEWRKIAFPKTAHELGVMQRVIRHINDDDHY